MNCANKPMRFAYTCAFIGLLGVIASSRATRPVHAASPRNDSIAVRLGSDVAVPLDEASGALVEEPSVAIRDSIVVVSWNDSHGGHRVQGRHDVGSAISIDGGRRFRSIGFVPDSNAAHYPVGGDSRLVVDERGDFFLATLGESADGTHLLLVFALEAPRYAAWKELARVAQSRMVIDKPAFERAANGRLMLAFTQDTAIAMSMSDDSGRTWSTPKAVSPPGARPRSGTALIPCAGNVWVAWTDTKKVPWDEVWIARSRDGGASFDPAVLHYSLAHTVRPPLGYALGPGPNALIQNDVALACFAPPGASPRLGLSAIEGVTDSVGAPTRSRILRWERVAATDQWSHAVDITLGDGRATRVFPSAAATSSTIATLFYEQIVHGSRTQVDAVLLVEDSAGRRSRVRLSDQPTDWVAIKGDMMYAPAQSNFGDYISLATDGFRYAAAWTDGREGRTRIHVRVVAPGSR
jgi:hypothetical protein